MFENENIFLQREDESDIIEPEIESQLE